MAELFDVIVKKRHIEGGNIAVIEFESTTSLKLPRVQAGAHIDVHLPNGMTRQYSLCQNPEQVGFFRLGILRDDNSRGGSISAFNDLHEGLQIKVSSPKNLFPLVRARHSILIGGGIGITPLITMAYQLYNDGDSFELHYCGTSPEFCAFVDEIKNSVLAEFTTFHFKSEGGNHREYFHHILENIDKENHFYTCGPNGFMDWVIDLALKHHIPMGNIHKEYFQTEIETMGDAFEVFAKQSDKIDVC